MDESRTVAPPQPRVDILRALKDAGLTALIALGLLLPLVGFQTVQNIRNELTLETRPRLLLIFILILATGRFVISLAWPWIKRRAVRRQPIVVRAPLARWIAPFAL